MTGWTLGKPVWPWAGVLCALLAWGLAAPSEATAGCGDHTALSVFFAEEVSRFDPLILGESRSWGADQPPLSPADRSAPCQGAFCSGRSGIPTAPVPLLTHDIERWAYSTRDPGGSGLDSAPCLPAEDVMRPIHAGLDVFHPPRHVRPSSLR